MTKLPHPSSAIEASGVERQLRQSAPALPPTLRNQTLANCKMREAEQQRRKKRLQWQLTGAVFGVLTIQWLALSVVNAQNTQLLAGNSEPPLFASMSFADINHLWQQRSRELAQLMPSSGIG